MKRHVLCLGLVLSLSACVPESGYYYVPTGEGKVGGGSPCGLSDAVISWDTNGVELTVALDYGNWDSFEKGPDRNLELTLLFNVLEGHTLKIESTDVQVDVGGEPIPRHTHLVSAPFCDKGINQCVLPLGVDITGGATLKNWQGKDFYNPKRFMIGVAEIPDLKAVPKALGVTLPSMSFDGHDIKPIHIGFKLESYFELTPLNGC